MINKFFKCGALGLCLEIFFTGLNSFIHHDKRLMGQSSIIMFPIYGMAVFIKPIGQILKKYNAFIRGSIYALLITSVEFLTGCFLKQHKMCPWDYSRCRLNLKGVIRADFLPVWFLVGLLYEKIKLSGR